MFQNSINTFMLINFEDAKLKLQIKKFNKTGAIPDAMYAGQIVTSQNNHQSLYWAKMLLAVESERDYNSLIKNLQTRNSDYKLLYTLSKYKKDFNPVCALYEELQRSQFKTNKNKFDKWIIEFCKSNSDKIIKSLEFDIQSINNFISRYKEAGKKYLPLLNKLLKKFNNYLIGFNLLKLG